MTDLRKDDPALVAARAIREQAETGTVAAWRAGPAAAERAKDYRPAPVLEPLVGGTDWSGE